MDTSKDLEIRNAEHAQDDAGTVPTAKPRTYVRTFRQVIAPPLLTGLVGLGVFEIVHRLELIPIVIMPSPVSVLEEMVVLVASAYFWENLWVTLQESLLGFFLGSMIGLVLGVGVGVSRWISRALYPYIVLVQAMPRVALAPVYRPFGFRYGGKGFNGRSHLLLPRLYQHADRTSAG